MLVLKNIWGYIILSNLCLSKNDPHLYSSHDVRSLFAHRHSTLVTNESQPKKSPSFQQPRTSVLSTYSGIPLSGWVVFPDAEHSFPVDSLLQYVLKVSTYIMSIFTAVHLAFTRFLPARFIACARCSRLSPRQSAWARDGRPWPV